LEKILKRKIYVGNLPAYFNSGDLELLFRNYGNIVSSKVYHYNGSEMLGKYGFIEMATEFEAANAIIHLNNFSITGRRISVSEVTPRY
jgi:RNA recognition motif-containing protein